MKRNIFALLIVLFGISTFAQQNAKSVVFTKTFHNYGTIKETDGLAIYKFEYTNKSNTPAIIMNVEASCGCTTPTWTKAPVPPGRTGFINVAYDPTDRPGNFDKEINVTFADKTYIKLRITGDVIAKDKKIEDIYRITIGDLRLRSKKVPFAKIKATETRIEFLEIANATNQNIKLTFKNVPAHINLKVDPEILKPNQTGAVVVTYNASKKTGTGFLKDNIKIVVNGKEHDNNIIQISATRVE